MALCRSGLLKVTNTLRQQERDIWSFLEQVWIAHHRGEETPFLLPDPCERQFKSWILMVCVMSNNQGQIGVAVRLET